MLAVRDIASGETEIIAERGRAARYLMVRGIRFEKWTARFELPADASEDLILLAYDEQIEQLRQLNYSRIDVVHASRDAPLSDAIHHRIASDHMHPDTEVIFFVQGGGIFFFQERNQVLELACGRGDLVMTPPRTLHRFEGNQRSAFAVIRAYDSPDGRLSPELLLTE